MSRTEALEEAIRRTRTRLEYYCNEANAGRMPGDAREFMRRVQCGFDSLFEEAAALEQGVDATLKQFDRAYATTEVALNVPCAAPEQSAAPKNLKELQAMAKDAMTGEEWKIIDGDRRDRPHHPTGRMVDHDGDHFAAVRARPNPALPHR
jgi:hypothetical protein